RALGIQSGEWPVPALAGTRAADRNPPRASCNFQAESRLKTESAIRASRLFRGTPDAPSHTRKRWNRIHGVPEPARRAGRSRAYLIQWRRWIGYGRQIAPAAGFVCRPRFRGNRFGGAPWRAAIE